MVKLELEQLSCPHSDLISSHFFLSLIFSYLVSCLGLSLSSAPSPPPILTHVCLFYYSTYLYTLYRWFPKRYRDDIAISRQYHYIAKISLYRSSTERFRGMQLMSLYRLCRDIAHGYIMESKIIDCRNAL